MSIDPKLDRQILNAYPLGKRSLNLVDEVKKFASEAATWFRELESLVEVLTVTGTSAGDVASRQEDVTHLLDKATTRSIQVQKACQGASGAMGDVRVLSLNGRSDKTATLFRSILSSGVNLRTMPIELARYSGGFLTRTRLVTIS